MLIGFHQRIDYYYFHNIPDFLVFIAFFPKILFGKKIVLDIHDPMSFSLKSRFNKKHDSFEMKLIRLIELASWKFSDLIITVNLRCKNLIEDGLKTKKKIEIVMNLPDRKIFEIDSKEKIKEFENRFVMLYTGTLTNWYGLDIAINALPALKKTIPNILLCIIGKGPEKKSLLELTQNIDVRDALLFKNPLPQKELIPYIKQCTVGITVHRAIDFSKIYFSTKVVEFLYCNKTVICAKTEGIVDYFSENDLFYFEPENIIDFTDKVIEMKNNPEQVKKKLLSAKEKLKYLDWEIEKQKFHDIIK
jgi:glycosyltransferase involved in cell wall biosynthesis